MAEKRRRKEKNFLIQGSILAFAGVITKIIGAVYRIPLMNIVGTEGMGYYGVAFSIYTIALMLTSYSLPLAVSKLVSARVAVGQYRNAYKVFRCALSIAVIASGIISLVIFFGAEFIAGTLMAMDMSVYALRVLAPCIFVVALHFHRYWNRSSMRRRPSQAHMCFLRWEWRLQGQEETIPMGRPMRRQAERSARLPALFLHCFSWR